MSKSIFFFAILSIAFLEVSMAQECPESTLIITQAPTSMSVPSKPEWKVTVTNNCVCSLTLVKLSCPKFVVSTVQQPSVITLDSEGNCILKGLNPLTSGESIEFTYASSRIDFKLLESYVACS